MYLKFAGGISFSYLNFAGGLNFVGWPVNEMSNLSIKFVSVITLFKYANYPVLLG